MVKFLSADIILRNLGLKEKLARELNRLHHLQEIDNESRQKETASSPGQQQPHIPQPPKDLEKPISPDFLKRFPPPSPIVNDSKRVRFAELDNKNTSASCSFLGENSGNYEGSICTSTPVKYVKRPKSPKSKQGTTSTGLFAIAEPKEEMTITDHESIDSGLECSTNSAMMSQPTVKSTKSHNIATSESNRLINLKHSKISPKTIKKLKQFAFIERSPTKTAGSNDAQNLLIGEKDEKCEKRNGENIKQHSAFRVEEGVSADGLLLTQVSNTNKAVSSENINVNSLLRTRSPGQTMHRPDKRVRTGQLQRIRDLMPNSVNQNNVRTESTTLSPGFSKLLTLCNKAKPLHTSTVPQNSITTAENKTPTLVRGHDEKTSSDAQKRKAKQTANVNSLFTLNEEGNLSDIDLESDWSPATKKKKM